jgi:hypothetical protein
VTASNAIQLRSGVVIEEPLTYALEFIAKDGSYRAYDLVPVAHDETLTYEDVRLANMIVARMPPRVINNILDRATRIEAALARIPRDATLVTPDSEVPWDGIRMLFEAMTGVEEVGLPRATKVLHKKRPALIPILDEVVMKYLRAAGHFARHPDPATDAIHLIESYKSELDANATTYAHLRTELSNRGFVLTECRILDIFLWAYSGTYTPQYMQ